METATILLLLRQGSREVSSVVKRLGLRLDNERRHICCGSIFGFGFNGLGADLGARSMIGEIGFGIGTGLGARGMISEIGFGIGARLGGEVINFSGIRTRERELLADR
jgi:hypothetical protein